jgi:hypothetical protein
VKSSYAENFSILQTMFDQRFVLQEASVTAFLNSFWMKSSMSLS